MATKEIGAENGVRYVRDDEVGGEPLVVQMQIDGFPAVGGDFGAVGCRQWRCTGTVPFVGGGGWHQADVGPGVDEETRVGVFVSNEHHR